MEEELSIPWGEIVGAIFAAGEDGEENRMR